MPQQVRVQELSYWCPQRVKFQTLLKSGCSKTTLKLLRNKKEVQVKQMKRELVHQFFFAKMWAASNNAGVLESLGYKEGYRVDVDIPEGTWAEAPNFHDILIFNTGHWNSNMSEAQRRPMTVGVKHSNGYLNGSIPLRSPTMVSEVDKFRHALEGKKPIHSVLIANNGMQLSSLYVALTWACETFGTEKAISLVAMATSADMRINVEHIRINTT